MATMLRALSVRTDFSLRTTTSTVPPPYSPNRPPRYASNIASPSRFHLHEPQIKKPGIYISPTVFFRTLMFVLALSSIATGAATSPSEDGLGAGHAEIHPAIIAMLGISTTLSIVEIVRLFLQKHILPDAKPQFAYIGTVTAIDAVLAIVLLILPASLTLPKQNQSVLVGVHVGLAFATGCLHLSVATAITYARLR